MKLSVLTLTNDTDDTRRLSVFGYVEWCMGPPRSGEQRFVVTDMDEATGVLFSRNTYNVEFAGSTGFWRATDIPQSYTADRTELVGRHHTLRAPAALFRARLAGRTGAGLDPCGALQVSVELGPRESRRVAFVLGHGHDRAHAIELAERYASVAQA